MRATILRLCVVLATVFVLAPAAHAGGPALVLGATEDAVRAPTLAGAKAEMDMLVLAGFRGVRITQIWAPGNRTVSEHDRTILENVAAAAKLDHVTVLTSITNQGSRTTPLSDDDQADFAAYAASVVKAVPELKIVVVGNEPNLNRYWLPQFSDDGTDAAAPAYESLLAHTYDSVKAVSSDITVLGGAVSPRGGDVAGGIRPTHSPTVFIQDLGRAYRDSGRTDPIMDGFAFHPYEDDSSIAPVDGAHPELDDDLARGLRQARRAPWRGFRRLRAADLVRRVRRRVADPARPSRRSTPARSRRRRSPCRRRRRRRTTGRPCSSCSASRTCVGSFSSTPSTRRISPRGSPGVYYADGTPKTSLQATKLALGESRRGIVAHCDGLELPVKPKLVQRGALVTLTCDLDCTYVAELYRLPGKLLVTKRGRATGGTPTTLPLRVPKAAASYRIRLSAIAPVNPGKPALLRVNVRHG